MQWWGWWRHDLAIGTQPTHGYIYHKPAHIMVMSDEVRVFKPSPIVIRPFTSKITQNRILTIHPHAFCISIRAPGNSCGSHILKTYIYLAIYIENYPILIYLSIPFRTFSPNPSFSNQTIPLLFRPFLRARSLNKFLFFSETKVRSSSILDK